MNVIQTDLPGVVILEPKVFADDRGFFLESYNRDRFHKAGIAETFVQDNHSHSCKDVLRGLHYQLPHLQGKLIYCSRGSIFDVALDIRRGSPHFGRWTSAELTADNHRMLWVPAGFAHGFCALTDDCDVMYKCTAVYDPAGDRSLLWNDPEIAIPWPTSRPLLSPKDAAAPRLSEVKELPVFGA